MPEALRRVNPRYLAAAAVALGLFIWFRRDEGGGEAPPDGVFSPIPPGIEEELPVSGPITIPLPPQGGVIVSPSGDFDPIIYEPPKPAEPPAPPAGPKPSQPKPSGPKFLFRFGRYWRPNQLPAFHAAWTRRHKGKDTRAAWHTYLRRHPGVARFFGLAVPPPANRGAAAPKRGSKPSTVRTVSGAKVVTSRKLRDPIPRRPKGARRQPRNPGVPG